MVTPKAFQVVPEISLLFRTDPMGNLIWAKSYGGSSFETTDEWSKSLINIDNNRIMLVGSSTSFSGGNQDIYVIVDDIDGTMNCNQTAIPNNIDSVNVMTVSTPATIVNNTFPNTNFPIYNR